MPDPAELIDEVARRMRRTGLVLPVTEPTRGGGIRLRNDDLVLGIDRVEAAPPAVLLSATTANTTHGNAILAPRAAESGRTALRVSVEALGAPAGTAAPSPGQLATCFHATGLLAGMLGARTIHWHPTDSPFTPEAFDAARLRVPGLPGRESGPAALAPPPTLCPAGTGTLHPAPEGTPPPSGPARAVRPQRPVRPPVVLPRKSRPALDRAGSAPPPGPPASACGSRRARNARCRAASGADRTIRGHRLSRRAAGPARPSAVQLAVYTMSLTIMVFSFPVGFALMIYNILGGERPRPTTLAMAVTCAAWGLNRVGLTESLLALF